MGIGTTGAHFHCDPDRLHQLLLRGTMPRGRFGMALDARGTLGDMRDCDGEYGPWQLTDSSNVGIAVALDVGQVSSIRIAPDADTRYRLVWRAGSAIVFEFVLHVRLGRYLAPGGAARDLERIAGWKGLLQLPIKLLFDCFPITLLASSGIPGHDATSIWPVPVTRYMRLGQPVVGPC